MLLAVPSLLPDILLDVVCDSGCLQKPQGVGRPLPVTTLCRRLLNAVQMVRTLIGNLG